MVGNAQLDTDLVGGALLCIDACHGTRLAVGFVDLREESALQSGFIALLYQDHRPVAHISVKEIDVFNLSKKR